VYFTFENLLKKINQFRDRQNLGDQ